MLRIGRIGAGLLLVMVLLVGCGREAGDPWVISLAGRQIPLSEIEFEFNRLHGVDQWAAAPEDVRTQFVETYARKEVLVERAHELYPQLPQREQMIFDRWLEKQIMSRYWRAILESIEVPQSHVDSLAGVMAEERYLRQVVCQYDDDAREIYAKIKGGADFMVVANEYHERNPSAVVIADVGWVNRPSLAPPVGTALFELSGPGEVAEPCETQRYGWHVVTCDSIRAVEPELARLRAEEIAPQDYRRGAMQMRVQEIENTYSITIERESIGPIQRHFRAMYDSLNADKSAGKQVDYQALQPPIHRFSDAERVMPLARWSGGVFTIGDFVNSLWKIDLDYWPTIGDVDKIVTQLTRRMNRWAFVKEAEKAGTLEDPELQREMKRKQDELILDRFHADHLKVYGDRVTDDDVRAYWDANQEKYASKDMVGYGFIRFPPDAHELAMRTYEMIQSGTDFSLAATNAGRTNPDVVYELNLDPTSGPPYPEITALAMNYEPGDEGPVYSEPLQVDGDWVLLRVYFRSHPRKLSFEVAKEYVTRDLQRLAMEDTLLTMLDELGTEYGLELNLNAIR